MVPSVAHHILPVCYARVRSVRIIDVDLSGNVGCRRRWLDQVNLLKLQLLVLEPGGIALALLDLSEEVVERNHDDSYVVS